jgi:hypothetical protein
LSGKVGNNLTRGCKARFRHSFLRETKFIEMKKTIFTLFVVLTSWSAFAQFEQGTLLVGGNFGLEFTTSKSKFSNQTNTISKTTRFGLEPRVGYFVIDHLAVGAGVGLSLYSEKIDDSDNKYSQTEIMLSPFVRYYFDPGFFVEGKVGLGVANSKNEFGGDVDKDKYALGQLALGAGYAIFLNDNVALEPMIGFQSMSQKVKTSGEPEVKYIDSGLFLRVGFQIYLR